MAQSAMDRVDPRISQPDLVAPSHRPVARPQTRIAPPPAPIIDARAGEVTIGAIRVEGAARLTQADFAAAISPWLGRRLSAADMSRVATDIAGVARAKGYVFARASVPAQTLSAGVLVVALDEGRIDAVRIEGAARGGIDAVFAPLANGEPVTRAALERRVMIAGDVPGVEVGEIKLRREGGRNILIVPVTVDRVWGRASIDNRGTSLIGPVRMRLEGDVAGVVLDRDLLTVEGAITPLQPREFALASARYAISPGSSGLQLAASGYYAKTQASGPFRVLGIEGENYEIAAEASLPLARSRPAGLWAQAGLAVRRSLQQTGGLRIREDRVSVATLGLRGHAPIAEGLLRASAGVDLGLGLFNATRRGEPLSSNSRGSGRFVAFHADSLWLRPLTRQWTLRATLAAQLASRPLLSGEQFSLGGQRLLRGYDYGERLGDEGAAGSLELAWALPQSPKPLGRVELYAFVDGGTVRDKRLSGHASLASAGGGLRADLGKSIAAGFEAAAPLTGARFDSGAKRPRLSFVLSALF